MKTFDTFFRFSPGAARPFAGQLNPEFQSMLAEEHAGVQEADCHFYHFLDLGNGRVVPGGWDIRENELNYQGHVDYQGRRVLEFGAAGGYLSFWMEKQGAEVVAVDLPPNHPPDLVPLPGIDLEKHALSGAKTAREVRNSWWFARRELKADAQALYADIYQLPGDIGRYDISTFGSILLHLSNPFRALHEAARVTDKAIVVTDMIPDVLFGSPDNSFVEFNPGEEQENLVNWWRVSPGAIRKMLRVLGFPEVDVHFFENIYYPQHDPGGEAHKRFMFTAVGRRKGVELPRLPKTDAQKKLDRTLRETVPVISVDNYNETHRRLQEAHGELNRIRSSVLWKAVKPLRLLTGLK